jgi:hypothetical protein
VYTLTPQPDGIPERLIPEDVRSWNRQHLRNFLYPPEYEIFMNMLHKHQSIDGELLSALPAPPVVTEATLHSDAAPAFVGLTKCTPYSSLVGCCEN